METTTYGDALRTDLLAIVGADEQAAAVADRMARALDSSFQLRFLDALGEAAAELSEQLAAGHVEVRLAGRDARLVLVTPPEATAVGTTTDDEDGGTARLTLRMPDIMKSRVEEAADQEQLSVNAWLVRAVGAALERRREPARRARNRITGYAQS
jgi:hypothetical protein